MLTLTQTIDKCGFCLHREQCSFAQLAGGIPKNCPQLKSEFAKEHQCRDYKLGMLDRIEHCKSGAGYNHDVICLIPEIVELLKEIKATLSKKIKVDMGSIKCEYRFD